MQKCDEFITCQINNSGELKWTSISDDMTLLQETMDILVKVFADRANKKPKSQLELV
jgi:hypothetical protein